MSLAYLFLAEGFEEIEALTPVDVLRRAGIDVRTVSVGQDLLVTGRSGICVRADLLFEECDADSADLLILPGGMPGTRNLAEHKGLTEVLLKADREKKLIAAICAAPTVLGGLHITDGRRATSYPGTKGGMKGCIYVEDEAVVTDGHIVTSRGAGTAMEFSLKLAELLAGPDKSAEVARGIVWIAGRA